MRPNILAVVSLMLIVTAARLVPARNEGTGEPERPPHRAALLVASLGRSEVAADLAWLRLVQLIGDVRYARARYPALEQWIALIVDLHPRLVGPFYFGVTLLLGDPHRRDTVEQLLDVAERRLPDDYRFSLERGVLAYFGRFDALAAADHLERAAKKPDAPPFVGMLAKTLRSRGVMCNAIAADAASIAQGAAVLGDRTIDCVKRRIEAASAAARLNEDPFNTLDELIARGHLPPGALVPGVCWELKGVTATPRACSEAGR
ncbi:MAG: hypothetical protein FJ137_07855 [Deltaproteobacteria bacterium]|nr:hypothetical protein [Deltaproteobacteria bacterium]